MQQDLLDSAFGRFPVLGDEIAASVNRPSGGVVAIVVGVGVALFAGLAATVVAQDAMNATFDAPVLERGAFLVRRLRGLVTAAVFGTAVVATTVLGAVSRLVGLGGALGRVVASAGRTYGVFAIVIGLLSWVAHPGAHLPRRRRGGIRRGERAVSPLTGSLRSDLG